MNGLPSAKQVSNTSYSFRQNDHSPLAEVHNTSTNSWNPTPSMHTVLESWQNSLPKLYKYPKDQLEVVFHRGGDTEESGNFTTQTNKGKSSTPVSKGLSHSKVSLIPRRKHMDSQKHPTDKTLLLNPALDKPSSSMIHGISTTSVNEPILTDVTDCIPLYLTMEDKITPKPLFNIPSRSVQNENEQYTELQVMREENGNDECVQCVSLSKKLLCAEKELTFTRAEYITVSKILEIVTAEQVNLKAENERLKELLRRLNDQAIENVETMNEINSLENCLKDSPFSGPPEGLYSEDSIEKLLYSCPTSMSSAPINNSSTPLSTMADPNQVPTPMSSTTLSDSIMESMNYSLKKMKKHVEVLSSSSSISRRKIFLRPQSTFGGGRSQLRQPSIASETPKSSCSRVLNETFTQDVLR